MKKQIEISIPQYISIKQYKEILRILALESNLEKAVALISMNSNESEEDIKKLPPSAINQVVEKISEVLNIKEELYQLIEYKGVLYGTIQLDKMTLNEFILIENLSKDLPSNLIKLMTILYRPVTKHSLLDLKYNVKNSIKVIKHNNRESLSSYYTVEEYDKEKAYNREELFNDLPLSIALGAMGFFLSKIALLQVDTLTSLEEKQMMEKIVIENLQTLVSNNTMDGFIPSMS
jgi:hypothetical protein